MREEERGERGADDKHNHDGEKEKGEREGGRGEGKEGKGGQEGEGKPRPTTTPTPYHTLATNAHVMGSQRPSRLSTHHHPLGGLV